MKFLIDIFPIILFFVTFKFYAVFFPAESKLCFMDFCIAGGDAGAIYAATLVAIIAGILQVLYEWFSRGKVETMLLITLAMIIVLGGATLAFQNELFIKWKPTLVNWAFGIVFLGSQYIGEKNLIRRMMEGNVRLTDERIWDKLNLIWAVFFVVLGFINLYVAYFFSTEIWVNFKLFGLLGLTFAFVIGQAFYLTRYIVEENES
jgi:intracellular septation protein